MPDSPRLQPFGGLDELMRDASMYPAADWSAQKTAAARQNQLTKPEGSLGYLEDLAIFMCSWRGAALTDDFPAHTLVFAGNHGICAQGISAYPQSVTTQMVDNFKRGGAAINQLCRQNGSGLSVVPIELDRPTADFSMGKAMSEKECLDAVNVGVSAVPVDADILLLGEMGIGNTTAAAALCMGLFGAEANTWVGRGTGLDDAALNHKKEVVSGAVSGHATTCQTPMDWLSAVGGREMAAIVGAIVAARIVSVPVLLDGFICTAAASVLHAIDPRLLDHTILGHVSAEPGHRHLADLIGKEPVLSLNMRLGEGSGAAAALGIIRSAMACHSGMATFADAMVDTKIDA